MLEFSRNASGSSVKDFTALFKRAGEKYPFNPRKQLDFFKKEQCNPKFELLALLKIVQGMIDANHDSVTMDHWTVDMIFRTLSDLALHLQENLPDGVYDYNLKNLEGVTDQIFSQARYINEEKDISFDQSYLI